MVTETALLLLFLVCMASATATEAEQSKKIKTKQEEEKDEDADLDDEVDAFVGSKEAPRTTVRQMITLCTLVKQVFGVNASANRLARRAQKSVAMTKQCLVEITQMARTAGNMPPMAGGSQLLNGAYDPFNVTLVTIEKEMNDAVNASIASRNAADASTILVGKMMGALQVLVRNISLIVGVLNSGRSTVIQLKCDGSNARVTGDSIAQALEEVFTAGVERGIRDIHSLLNLVEGERHNFEELIKALRELMLSVVSANDALQRARAAKSALSSVLTLRSTFGINVSSKRRWLSDKMIDADGFFIGGTPTHSYKLPPLVVPLLLLSCAAVQ
ncbi:hypothetical protein TRVL_03764 [Trypanosoma vivax]|nr:hypothetical protein TRVL_03764 [Trypanosoma vivax]